MSTARQGGASGGARVEARLCPPKFPTWDGLWLYPRDGFATGVLGKMERLEVEVGGRLRRVSPQGFLTPSPLQTKTGRTGDGQWGGKAALDSKGLPKSSAAEVSSRCPPLGSAGSMPQPSLLSSPGRRMHTEAHGHPRASPPNKTSFPIYRSSSLLVAVPTSMP